MSREGGAFPEHPAGGGGVVRHPLSRSRHSRTSSNSKAHELASRLRAIRCSASRRSSSSIASAMLTCPAGGPSGTDAKTTKGRPPRLRGRSGLTAVGNAGGRGRKPHSAVLRGGSLERKC